jgi:hypothetical protein
VTSSAAATTVTGVQLAGNRPGPPFARECLLKQQLSSLSTVEMRFQRAEPVNRNDLYGCGTELPPAQGFKGPCTHLHDSMRPLRVIQLDTTYPLVKAPCVTP